MTLDEFKKLMPDEMKENLMRDPLMDIWVARLKTQPADTEEMLQYHIDWYLQNMIREGHDPRPEDPHHLIIRMMIDLAGERIAREAGANLVDGGRQRH